MKYAHTHTHTQPVHPHRHTCMNTDTGPRSGNVSQHAISLFLPLEVS